MREELLLKISNLRVNVEDNTPLKQQIAGKLKLPVEEIVAYRILKKALDARRKHRINFVYTLEVEIRVAEGNVLARLAGDQDITQLTIDPLPEIIRGNIPLEYQPVVIGAGPAGLVAALTLAQYGYKPILLERGQDVDQRAQEIERFWQGGRLNPASNVQFGEGGAGTFSDGKLTTRVTDPYMLQVLDLFIAAGAPPEIRYSYKPHVGTDKLRNMVKNLRKKITELGGQVQFQAKVTEIQFKQDAIHGVIVNHETFIPAKVVLLAIGHSARDTYEMLFKNGVTMESKPFAIGVRIEHPQSKLDHSQYGSLAGHPNLGPADYALVYHDKQSQRTAYSFCMCPGGLVVGSASEEGGVVTNGMSLYQRNSGIANSALVVNVNPSDCGSGVLSTIAFQRHYERLAFKLSEHYYAPVQTVGDFLLNKSGSKKFLCRPTYRPGIQSADLHQCLPTFVAETLAGALPYFGRKIPVFKELSAPMTGVETRTSAPVRIIRQDNFQAVNREGLYPIGEGAGYAGGIMSAALDGLHAAYSVISRYCPEE